jgi:hypothetical protein
MQRGFKEPGEKPRRFYKAVEVAEAAGVSSVFCWQAARPNAPAMAAAARMLFFILNLPWIEFPDLPADYTRSCARKVVTRSTGNLWISCWRLP